MNKVTAYLFGFMILAVLFVFGLSSCQSAAAANNAAKAVRWSAFGQAMHSSLTGLAMAVLATVPIVALVSLIVGLVVLGIFCIKYRAEFARPQVQIIEKQTVILLPPDASRHQLFELYGQQITRLIEANSIAIETKVFKG